MADDAPQIDPSILALVRPEPKADKPADAKPATDAQATQTAAADDKSAVTDAKDDAAATDGDGAADDAGGNDDGDKPAAGTPDKALQKIQQDLSAANRKIAQLGEKLEAGEKLTDKDKKDLAKAKSKVSEVAELLKEKKFSGIDHEVLVAETLVELAESGTATKSELAEMRATLAEMKAAQAFDTYAKEFPGVDVRSVWDKAQKDAAKYKVHGESAFAERASELFFDRCDAAAKSLAAKKPKEDPAPAAGATKTTPAPSKNDTGSRVIVPSLGIKTSPPPTADQAYLDTALSLVKQD